MQKQQLLKANYCLTTFQDKGSKQTQNKGQVRVWQIGLCVVGFKSGVLNDSWLKG